MSELRSTREAYGQALVELGGAHPDAVVLDADLAHATCSNLFHEAYPERFFNLGIAEQNMFCVAAGMAKCGLVPFAATFAIFGAGRSYEQIRNSICYTGANVKIAGHHAGITPFADGGSHQCIEDLALMRVLPGMTILSPCDYPQTIMAVHAAYALNGPVYIRICREPVPAITEPGVPLEVGKAQLLRDGSDICIVATGYATHLAVSAAKRLEERGISACVLNMHTVKPLDDEAILDRACTCKRMVAVEEHSVIGGLGDAVGGVVLGKEPVRFAKIGIEDRFGQSGLMAELFEEYGLTTQHVEEVCLGLF